MSDPKPRKSILRICYLCVLNNLTAFMKLNWKQTGLIYAEIELINGDDLALAGKHIIGAEEVRRMTIYVLVNTGSHMLAINKVIQEQLRSPVVKKKKAQQADGHVLDCDVVSRVEI
jgi:hypothetical protein